MNEDKIGCGAMLAIGAFIVLVLTTLGWATSWFGLVVQRPMAKYAEETRAQVYDTSRQYNQGTNRDIARYCEQMRTAAEPNAKKAVAALIRSNIATFNGDLTPENQGCLAEAKGI